MDHVTYCLGIGIDRHSSLLNLVCEEFTYKPTVSQDAYYSYWKFLSCNTSAALHYFYEHHSPNAFHAFFWLSSFMRFFSPFPCHFNLLSLHQKKKKN